MWNNVTNVLSRYWLKHLQTEALIESKLETPDPDSHIQLKNGENEIFWSTNGPCEEL